MSSHVIGIDLGGTAIKLGRFTETGVCLQSLTVPTPQPAVPEAVIVAIATAVQTLDPDHQALHLGAGTPGPADATGRIARIAINLEGWHDVPLAERLEALTGRPTIIANDANCAGLGEAWLGAGRQFKNFILLTLGTGVGGAVFINGELFTGPQGAAGELGLVSVDLRGHACNSGNYGSLEQHVSVQAIRRRTGLEPHLWAEKAQAGDPEALQFWQTYGQELAAGLASSIYVLAPEAVVIGGGISASAALFFPAMEAELAQRVMPTSRENLKIVCAALGNQAGIAGAAKLAWQQLERVRT
jgi:glucokinase